MTKNYPICPRCGALSRVDNETEICSKCGTAEAMFNFANPGQPLPPVNQPVG